MTTSNTFFPAGYEVPKGEGKYMKLAQGKNRFRILAAPIIGWLGWREIGGSKKPLRKHYDDAFRPDEVDPEEVKHFWAIPVWNYDAKRVQVLEITQRTVQKAIEKYSKDADYGSPTGYDIEVERTGDGLNTEYSVIAKPPRPLDDEAASAWNDISVKFDLERLFDNGDPFGDEAASAKADDRTARTELLKAIFATAGEIWPVLKAAPPSKRSEAVKGRLHDELGITVTSLATASQSVLSDILRRLKAEQSRQGANEVGASMSRDEAANPVPADEIKLEDIPF